MKYIKPNKLKKGELIGIISPASTTNDPILMENGVKYFERLGYQVLPGKNLDKRNGYLAGTDEERLNDIHDMFSNRKVKAVFCLRGGYGASRLLDKIDYKLIQQNPKIFVGFSEITSLQMAFLAKSKLVTFAGPMVLPNFSENVNPFTEENCWATITSKRKRPEIKLDGEQFFQTKTLKKSSGKLIGGNLAVLTALVGTGYLPNFKNKILLLEEINEPPYKIDRMLNQLRLKGVFEELKGIILGDFIDCVEQDKNKLTLGLTEVLVDYFNRLNIPVINNFPFGHSSKIFTLPIGCKVQLDLNKRSVRLMEAGVT